MRSRTISRISHKRSQPPNVSAHEIVRLRLLDRLTTGSGNAATARIMLVRGPAGFGKTTLLAQAYRQVVARGDLRVNGLTAASSTPICETSSMRSTPRPS